MEAKIDQVVHWAANNGIELNGIRPQVSHGLGIFTTRNISAGEVMLHVPARMLITAANFPKDSMPASLAGASAHAKLAVCLALDLHPNLCPWSLMFPDAETLQAIMPICWGQATRYLLPNSAQEALRKQRDKYERDLTAVEAALPNLKCPKRDFLYSWLLVNTRSFYFPVDSSSKPPTTADADINVALQPIADLFNHMPTDACNVTYTKAAGFKFTAARNYARGEEVFVRYGAHSNDTLLVEYGFSLPHGQNPWDEIDLTKFMKPLFTESQSNLLRLAGFGGPYALDSKSICYRTKIALRLLCVTHAQWNAVVTGDRDEDLDSSAANVILKKLLLEALAEIKGIMKLVEALPAADSQDAILKDMLSGRWLQMVGLIADELERIKSAEKQGQDNDNFA